MARSNRFHHGRRDRHRKGAGRKARSRGLATALPATTASLPTPSSPHAATRYAAVQCNITDDASVTSALEEIGRAIGEGSLDLLVNNAATTGGAGGGVENVDIDRFKALFEVNFWGPVRVTQAALPFIRRSEQGRIINVGSVSQYLTIPMGCSYPVTKAALQRLTRALRAEMKPFGIQVSCVEPGGVKTPMMDLTEEQEAELWGVVSRRATPAVQGALQIPGRRDRSHLPALDRGEVCRPSLPGCHLRKGHEGELRDRPGGLGAPSHAARTARLAARADLRADVQTLTSPLSSERSTTHRPGGLGTSRTSRTARGAFARRRSP